jgi:hypothetical protein
MDEYRVSVDVSQSFFDPQLTVKRKAANGVLEFEIDGMYIINTKDDGTKLVNNAKIISALTSELFAMLHRDFVATLEDAVVAALDDMDIELADYDDD